MMKQFLITLFSILSLTSALQIKFMSFNIDCRFCDFHKEHGKNFHERTDNEKDTIARHNPDIIGIEEPIFGRDVDLLLNRKEYKALYFNESFLPWKDYPDATIFYKHEKFTPLDFHMFWLGPNASEPRGFDKPRTPRLAIFTLFEEKLTLEEKKLNKTPLKFYFGATHFDHGDDFEGNDVDCVYSAYELLDMTAPYAKEYPFLWVGDFNSRTKNNNAYSILTNTTADFHLVDSYYESATTPTITHNQPTEPEYSYDGSIDHIFFSNNFDKATYKTLDWTVDMTLYGTEGNQYYASDHYAIISTIDVQQI